METIYLGIVFFLFILAIFDLVVGVSNDAVNFLNSAIGAKVARFRTILVVAAVGILVGAVFSNGMMDIARHGIFQPQMFTFNDLMCIFLAVMVTDVVLLDVFNSLGMPTSTTVSMVFELLGGTFVLALLKIASDETGTLGFAELMNTEKALSVILGIFLSVAVALVVGTVVQWTARLIFTFNYRRNLSYTIGVFGGVATTSILYFSLVKGLKGSTLVTPEMMGWVDAHLGVLIGGCFVVSTVLMQVLHWMRVNIFKIVVLMGTFALAMAFAGNDLVNFIGVPLAAFSSYQDYAANGAGNPDTFLMGSLNEPASTPFVFLLAAGIVMVIALATSKKAHNVIKTSVDLSRQDEGEEMFGSSRAARSIVRGATTFGEYISSYIPKGIQSWIDTRFNKQDVLLAPGAAFDLVRASVNLVVAGLLIIMGTSLKLPLSTTYVTFIVAMGSSLADRAWTRESAVFRITGVLNVVGVVFQRMMATKDPAESWGYLKKHVAITQKEVLDYIGTTYAGIVDGFADENLRQLRKATRGLDAQRQAIKKLKQREIVGMRRIDKKLSLEKNTWFHLGANSDEQMIYCLKRMGEPCREHVDNNFNPLPDDRTQELMQLKEHILDFIARAGRIMDERNFDAVEPLLSETETYKDSLSVLRKQQFDRLQAEDNQALKVSLVYLNVLQESQELLSCLRHDIRAFKKFQA